MQLNILLFLDVFNPETIIQYGGLTFLLLIIFAETGLFFGFFLPGDSLLFIAGLLSDSKYLHTPVYLLILYLVIAAVLGSTVGYLFGRWTSDYLKNKKENIFYKKKYLDITSDFYAKYGGLAFILGRFLPVIRTFVPILAGMTKINFSRFQIYNILGASVWIAIMVLAGHFLGKLFPKTIGENIELIVLIMVVVTFIPVYITWRKNRTTAKIER
jgi:membrane-associated protein